MAHWDYLFICCIVFSGIFEFFPLDAVTHSVTIALYDDQSARVG